MKTPQIHYKTLPVFRTNSQKTPFFYKKIDKDVL